VARRAAARGGVGLYIAHDGAHLLVALDHPREATEEAHVYETHAQRHHDEGERTGLVAREACAPLGLVCAGLAAGAGDGDELPERLHARERAPDGEAARGPPKHAGRAREQHKAEQAARHRDSRDVDDRAQHRAPRHVLGPQLRDVPAVCAGGQHHGCRRLESAQHDQQPAPVDCVERQVHLLRVRLRAIEERGRQVRAPAARMLPRPGHTGPSGS